MSETRSVKNMGLSIPPGAGTGKPSSPRRRRSRSHSGEMEVPTWTARPYQQDALDAFHDGKRRQLLIWHRRAGKDNFALNLASQESRETVGTYWHLYPTHVQARRAIWNGIDKTGVRFIDQAFPPGNVVSKLKQDMSLELTNGSTWQLCGSDRYDSLVGSNPRGVVFSEWALCDPRAWDYIRPIIRENNGWVVFITTYRGRNHAYRMFQRLQENPDWFVDLRTVEDTVDQDGNPILTEADIQAEREEGMSEALLRQEYYCDPIASFPGSIYGKSLETLLREERNSNVRFDPALPVVAAWSLSESENAVVYFQTRGNENRVIGSASFPFASLSESLDLVDQAFPWRYVSRHIVSDQVGPGEVDTFESRGLWVEQNGPNPDTVHHTRELLGTVWIDNEPRAWTDGENNNERVIDALQGYRYQETKDGTSFAVNPANTWQKHYAQAFEVFATWRQDSPLQVNSWGPAPSTDIWDRAAI